MTLRPGRTSPRPKGEIGWRELISLPDFGIVDLPAKIDTGARTSSLHAVDLRTVEDDNSRWVEFRLPYEGKKKSIIHRAQIFDLRWIKNTSGVPEQRYVIETRLVFGTRRWHIQVSLANRENMEFELILGRSALKGRGLLINPSRSYLFSAPSIQSLPERQARSRERDVAKRPRKTRTAAKAKRSMS